MSSFAPRIRNRSTIGDVALQPARTLQEAIESLVGSAVLIDLSFPRACMSEDSASEVVRVLPLPRDGFEQDFLSRFRQSGGHQPINAWDLSELVWPPQIASEGESFIIGLESLDALASFGERLRPASCPLLVPAPAGGAGALRDRVRMRGYRVTRLIERGGIPAFVLLSPLENVQSRSGRDSDGASFTALDTEIFDAKDRHSVIEARSMIHDGGYVSEGDRQYSWLWTGPSAHFRLIAPHPAGQRPRLVEICVPRTEDPINLELVAAQLDGRPIRHSLDRWSDTSGKISIEIPGGSDYSALTLIIPRMTPDRNSGRLLGLCIDKMILTP
ncbi:hypothetical protein [Terrarubrum flagellatum]|uniref:hypothetical protein n=1 Tax=Terrirubrum flagellatum TaxID=2895980 RepID=UPI003144F7E7